MNLNGGRKEGRNRRVDIKGGGDRNVNLNGRRKEGIGS